MGNLPRHVLLIDGDPLVLEGMQLLLQDLHCEVSLLHGQQELRTLLRTHPECPQLIIAPTVMECGSPGERFIHEIRAHYRSTILAILLATDYSFNTESARHDNIVTLSDGLNPKRLRKVITELLGHDSVSRAE